MARDVGWKRRFFSLEGSTLTYALDEAGGAPDRGRLSLRPDWSVVEVLDAHLARRADLGFVLRTETRTFYIRAADEWQHKARSTQREGERVPRKETSPPRVVRRRGSRCCAASSTSPTCPTPSARPSSRGPAPTFPPSLRIKS